MKFYSYDAKSGDFETTCSNSSIDISSFSSISASLKIFERKQFSLIIKIENTVKI